MDIGQASDSVCYNTSPGRVQFSAFLALLSLLRTHSAHDHIPGKPLV